LRAAVPVAVVFLVVFLYWRPIASYTATRADLGERRVEVAALRAQKAALERALERSTNTVVLAREARRSGLVRQGEQLFIVKGIAGWREEIADGK
jgi:hypothetical protein